MKSTKGTKKRATIPIYTAVPQHIYKALVSVAKEKNRTIAFVVREIIEGKIG